MSARSRTTIRRALTLGAVVAFVAAGVPSTGAAELATSHAGPPAGVVPATAQTHASPGSAAGSSPNLIWHNGPVKHTTVEKAIFWGPSWASSSFVQDKISGLDSFYAGMGASTYAGTNGEYTDSTGPVGTAVNSLGHVIDTSATPRRAPSTSAVLAEVASQISDPKPDGYYPVYVDLKRGHAGYCAWHSAGTVRGVTVQFAFFFNLDGDPGCDPKDTSGLHSQGLAALGNVSGHELSEAMTDPHIDAWYDSSGAENADKCAWKFGANLLTFKNGTRWRIQGNWSNAAYDGGTGYGGNIGCIDGTN
jgi:hypothetical protein